MMRSAQRQVMVKDLGDDETVREMREEIRDGGVNQRQRRGVEVVRSTLKA